ncbi:MAG TPA: hypothetical protein VN887_00725 [Candidatus Angelobacter sp.]|nr:hypothetical protein [Candidatus Angelobacter sp.]
MIVQPSKKSGLRGSAIALLALAFLFAGCRRDEIAVYRVPREKEPVVAGAPPRIQWKTPPGWVEQTPGGMSVASFLIPGDASRKAQLSVMTFPGEGASELSLVNIVRENAGLSPVSDEELARLVETVKVGRSAAKLVDLTGAMNASSNAPPNRILVAVLARGGITWFFKLSGDATVVSEQKSAFLDFLNSIAFVESGGTDVGGAHFAGADEGRLPDAQPNDLNTSHTPAGKPSWEIPAGWQEVPPTEMLLAKFLAGGNDGKAEVTVSAFPGDAGGLLANVNRWRGQVGLAPIDQAELEKQITSLDVMGGKAMLVDVSGQNARAGSKARLIGVIVPREGQTWFYKLMGDPAVAQREKDPFIKFVQSVRYPNA